MPTNVTAPRIFTPKERRSIQRAIFTARLELIGKVYNLPFTLQTKCDLCARTMPALDVISAMMCDLATGTVPCTTTRHTRIGRVQPFLTVRERTLPLGSVKYFKENLTVLSRISPRFIRETYPVDFLAAHIFFGNLPRAFSYAGIDYPHKESVAWQEVIDPFLGKVPDEIIATCVGVVRRTICKYRDKKRIPPFDRSTLISE
jgi:hypothetical protein